MSSALSFTEPEKPAGYRYKVVSMLDESFGEVIAKLKTKPAAGSRYWDFDADRDPLFVYEVIDMWAVSPGQCGGYGQSVLAPAGKKAGGVVVKEEDKPSCLWCDKKLTPQFAYEYKDETFGCPRGKRVAVVAFGRNLDNLFCGINCGYKYAVWKMKKTQTQREGELKCS